MSSIFVVIMAAGKGSRMQSDLPKVLHPLAGRALLTHVLKTTRALTPEGVVVIAGHRVEQVVEHLAQDPAAQALATRVAVQSPQLGTGHAVLQALPHLPEAGTVLVLSGDVPLIEAKTLEALCSQCAGQTLALLTVQMDDPTGYGRIVRDASGEVLGIVEHKDATQAQRAISEIYSGVMAAPIAWLKAVLPTLGNDNAQGEYYLTDVVRLAREAGVPIVAHCISDAVQVAGVNTPEQLQQLEVHARQRAARQD